MISLDTHVLVRALMGTVNRKEKMLLSSHPWSVSSIVLWEIARLVQLGRVEMDLNDAGFKRILSAITCWPLDLDVCVRSTRLDFQGDPADELIAATAIVHNVPLLTRDRAIRRSKLVPFAG
ncbi:hypothetical protein ABI59_22415 [Acidobacteria bacterium Mor1]|nr:hypothetical protein ABI59_22415 [Acidobacteria bacterium Mor1]